MAKIDFDKGFRIEAKGNILIEKVINVSGNSTYIENYQNSSSTDNSSNNTQVNAVMAAEHDSVAEQLLPIFKGEAEQVQQFLSAIRGAQPSQITALVNDLIKQKKIVADLRFKPLWEILNGHGLYAPSLQNWDKQIR